MEPLDIRYNRILAIASIVVGVLLAVVSLLGQQWIGLAAGAILGVLGILMMVNPMLRIDAGEVQLRSPAGIVTKRFPVSAPGDLTLDGKVLRHVPQGKKVTALGAIADQEGVAALRSRLGSGSAE